MLKYLEAIEQLPVEIKLPLLKAFEFFKEEIAETVKRSDFEELKSIVKELAEAQKRTEQRVEELAEAQKESEKRLTRLEQVVAELAEAHKESEKRLTRLEQVVAELAEAQKRTEQRVEELAEAQKESEKRLTRLEQVVAELAEAQKRTEEELRKLIKEHERTREIVAGLSDTVGYGLEDKIMPYIPDFAKKEYGIEVTLVDRRNLVYPDGRYDELNIYVEGRKNGEKVYMIGECKSRPSKKDIMRFSEVLSRVKRYLNAPVYSFITGYYYSPEVEKYLKEKHPEIRAMKSFEFEMRYSRI
ncbi:MAG: hypothetical protein N2257_01950 [Thermodesulfovibrionales bacterium]|nr:hypothetical protein [Thermodesulfovibrionales bacterium]